MSVDWLAAEDAPLVDALRGELRCLETGEFAALFARAELHGLQGVVLDACTTRGAALPEDLARTLGAKVIARDLDHHAHLATLRRLDDELAAASLEGVVLKGALLGERLYPRPSARATSDIDLLVAEADLDRAAEALWRAGYRGFDGPSEARFRREHHHLHFAHAHAPPVELHFHAYRGFGSVLRSEPLIARSRAYPGMKALGVLAPPDELLYLAVHAAAHRFVRLGWLFDLKLLVGTMSEGDVALAQARAHEMGYARVLAFALDLVERTFAAPGSTGQRTAPRGAFARLVVRERGGALVRSASRFAYSAVLCDSLGATFAYARWATRGYVRRVRGVDG